MALTTPFIRLVHSGLIAGQQTWSFGIGVEVPNHHVDSDLQTWLTAVDGLLATYMAATGGATTFWSSDTTLAALTAYMYPAGQSKPDVVSKKVISRSVGTARTVPYQLAVVHSLIGGTAGRNTRGRVYLPLGTSGALSLGQVSNTTCANMATAFAAYLTGINATTIAGDPVQCSVGNPASSAGPFRIGTVIVDSVVDTQRRRRDKIAKTAVGTHTV